MVIWRPLCCIADDGRIGDDCYNNDDCDVGNDRVIMHAVHEPTVRATAEQPH